MKHKFYNPINTAALARTKFLSNRRKIQRKLNLTPNVNIAEREKCTSFY